MKQLLVTISSIILLASCDGNIRSHKDEKDLVSGDTIYVMYCLEWCPSIVQKNDKKNNMLIVKRKNMYSETFYMTECHSY